MKLLRQLFSRVVLVSLGIAIQLAWLFFLVFYLSAYYLPIAFALNLLSLAAVIFIINRPGNPQIKMAWIVPILIFPLFGGIIFLISGGKRPKRKLRRAMDRSGEMLESYKQGNMSLDLSNPASVPVRREDKYLLGQCHYLDKHGFPAYRATEAKYSCPIICLILDS